MAVATSLPSALRHVQRALSTLVWTGPANAPKMTVLHRQKHKLVILVPYRSPSPRPHLTPRNGPETDPERSRNGPKSRGGTATGIVGMGGVGL